MSWLDNLKGDNFLAVLDVMLDIKQEIDIKADFIQIPIMQTKGRFRQLLPIDSIDMRDKYCNLRWKATGFLQKNGIIKSFKIIQGTHRWYSFMRIDLDEKSFDEEFEKIDKEYKKRMESQMSIEEKRKIRFQFLHLLYELTGGDEYALQDIGDMAESLGYTKELAYKTFKFLEGEGLVKFEGGGAHLIYSITHEGVVEVERALSKPEESTEYFPPAINIIQIGEMKDSQIIQSSPDALQIKKNDKELIDKLKDLIEFARENIDKLELKKPEEQELQTEIQTIDIQLSSPKPKRNILKECVSSIRRIMEGATGQIIALQIIDKIGLIENLF